MKDFTAKTETMVMAIAMLLLAAGSGAGDADTNQPPQPLRLELDLTDGSRIIGIPGIQSIPLQTAYARMDIPLKQITTVKLADDHETASLDLVNDDKLKGVIALKPLELTTLFGPVKISVEHLRQIAVVSYGEGLPAALKKNLVLYYSFDKDEGEKVTDKSGKEHDGTTTGTTWVPHGKVGGARAFDGKSYITATGYKGILGRAPRTVATWIKTTNPSAVRMFAINWGGYPSSEARNFFNLSINEKGQAVLHLNWYELPSTMSVSDGVWHHLAVSTAETTFTLFVDGKAVATGSDPQFNTVSQHDVRIGKLANSEQAAWFTGLLDEVMIFDRTLSEAEVKSLYSARKSDATGQ